ncbi:DUF6010 family protein [Segetibacter sp.]|jgi:hypothetical protein|uniref:DUF6010 family protein n=1 Tax=Segetibacter sp. TaxID=2231182 RepID=UPI0026041220|nr:DUF6010 family protein [Segetibacter sp.]MCW3080522.1 hypothetical protein [Segetibacter sp.]
MIQLLSAIATALFVILFTILLSKHFSAKLVAATILCSIAFIYVGFSLKGNPLSSILLEILVAVVFYLIAVIGYSKNNSLIAYGIVLHGIWDVLHHKDSIVKTNIPDYYPLYCVIVDVLLGVYFFLVFRVKNNGKGINIKSF